MPKIYQVFIGCPFAKEVRKSYDKLKKDLEASTPLSIVLADTIGVTSSDYLLEHITELITDSAGCVFDATGANPNVSLEVGIAHTVPTDFILTLKTRGDADRVGSWFLQRGITPTVMRGGLLLTGEVSDFERVLGSRGPAFAVPQDLKDSVSSIIWRPPPKSR